MPDSILWRSIAELPVDRRDGRDLILWNGEGAIIGKWDDDMAGADHGVGGLVDVEYLPVIGITHWADITQPGGSEPVIFSLSERQRDDIRAAIIYEIAAMSDDAGWGDELFNATLDPIMAKIEDIIAAPCCEGGPQWGHAWGCPNCPA